MGLPLATAHWLEDHGLCLLLCVYLCQCHYHCWRHPLSNDVWYDSDMILGWFEGLRLEMSKWLYRNGQMDKQTEFLEDSTPPVGGFEWKCKIHNIRQGLWRYSLLEGHCWVSQRQNSGLNKSFPGYIGTLDSQTGIVHLSQGKGCFFHWYAP